MLFSKFKPNFGLLFIRVGLGITFLFHGIPKLMGGVETWTSLGSIMTYLGIDFMPVVWGFMASMSEVVGGLFLILGLLFRPALLLLIFTMFVAVVYHVNEGHQFLYPLELMIVFTGLFISGAGKYSIDNKIIKKR